MRGLGVSLADVRALRELDNRALERETREALGDVARFFCAASETWHRHEVPEAFREASQDVWFFCAFFRDERAAQAARHARDLCLSVLLRSRATPHVRRVALRGAFAAGELSLRFPALRPRGRGESSEPKGNADDLPAC